jgi:glucose-1-phosphate thymidylyltransferase|tara:strand:- start:10274 stop:11152 length:879 start_codon:yes stop_codon:yes gene_type:complete
MKNRKGIILAGGTGSRLWPITLPVCKQLLPVYNKPMIYYPLSTLMLAGIREILIITNPNDLNSFKNLLGDGSKFGIEISYKEQLEPKGIAEAFLIGKEFLDNSPCALILGDNIFYGSGFSELLNQQSSLDNDATVFAYYVNDPENFGICEFTENDIPNKIIEKPKNSISNWAITGLYFYDNEITKIAEQITPSARGELEISDINQFYLKNKSLGVYKLGRGYAWLDAGTNDNLLKASQFVKMVEELQGLKIGCPEEIAWRMGFISDKNLDMLITSYKSVEYADYLRSILKEK